LDGNAMMNEPYELKIKDDGVWMGFREFVRLVEELQAYGVDADVSQNDGTSARFTLKEAFRE
jgi:hypothetical protein